MKPGDIVRTTCDLTPLDDHDIPSGTRMQLIQSSQTSRGTRWKVADLTDYGRHRYGIPEDAIEVIQ